jgi:hypothetical protein
MVEYMSIGGNDGSGAGSFCLKISPAGGFSFQIGKKVLFVFLLVKFRINFFF